MFRSLTWAASPLLAETAASKSCVELVFSLIALEPRALIYKLVGTNVGGVSVEISPYILQSVPSKLDELRYR